MKIKEMTATFGKLHKATLRPGDGLNLVAAPNEGGKSTWCAFLRAMLYGFPARDRDKGGYIAEKNRYQPWSGAAMEGSMTITWQGRDLTLYRGPKGTTPWGTFTATYTATGEAVPGLTGENCGEVLLGVSREVFERTAFVGQGEIFLSPSADLEKRVAALATTGEEEVSFSQVERRLKDWLNRRKVNSRVGLIPELEGELQSIEETLARQGALMRQAQEAQQEKEDLEVQKAELESRLAAHSAARSAQQTQRRAEAQADYDEALSRVEELQKTAQAIPPVEELRQAQGDLTYLNTVTANLRQADQEAPQALSRARQAEEEADRDPYFPNQDPHFAAVQAQKDHDQVIKLLKKGLSPLLGLLIPLLVTLGALVYYSFLAQPDPVYAAPRYVLAFPWAVGSLAVGLVLMLCLFLMRRGRKKKAAAILARYEVQVPQEILARAAEYAKKAEEAQALRRAFQEIETERNKLLGQKDRLTAQLLALVHPFAPEVTDLFGVSAAISRALQQEEALRLAQAKLEHSEKLLTALPAPEAAGTAPAPLPMAAPEGDPTELAARLAAVEGELQRADHQAARLQGELNSSGDPAMLEARRSALLEELDKRRGEYDALAAALESLQAADSLLRERFSPAVSEKTGGYLAALTGGKYQKAALTRQFQALAQAEGDTTARQDLSLSAGTAQQLYLAVRLAVCDLALPQSDPCPILLDDALDAFDDERAKLALDCLLELAKTRQIFLFSCHSRERELLAGRPATLLPLPQ